MTFTTDCMICGKEYRAQRSTSKYCSGKCRQRARRKHKNDVNAQHEASIIIGAVNRLSQSDIKAVYDSNIGTGEQLSKALRKLSEMFEQFEDDVL